MIRGHACMQKEPALIMSRFTPIQTNGATSKLKRSLKKSHLKLDEAPRFLQVLANSPASLRAYIRADAALVHGQLTPRQREQVALAVAEINGSSYSLSAHYDNGKSLGLTHQEMQLARNATAADTKAETMLRFTQAVVLQRGEISDDDFQALRKAGFADGQITLEPEAGKVIRFPLAQVEKANLKFEW